MNQKLSGCLSSLRLRTLPLSLSGVLLGGFIVAAYKHIDLLILLFTILTASFLQILGNLANDLGDAEHGTDNSDRVGPHRAIQAGVLSLSDMRLLVKIFVILSTISGIMLVVFAYNVLSVWSMVALLLFGLFCIIAAIKYTVGSNAYGYKGFGDLFVFIFYGIVSCFGTWLLQTDSWQPIILLPASSIGLFSIGVLNLNNMRDIKNDAAHGKRTIPVIIGLGAAKIYHAVLIGGGFLCMLIFMYAVYDGHFRSGYQLLFLIALPLFVYHINSIWNLSDEDLDSHLKILSLSCLVFSILGGWGIYLSLS